MVAPTMYGVVWHAAILFVRAICFQTGGYRIRPYGAEQNKICRGNLVRRHRVLFSPFVFLRGVEDKQKSYLRLGRR